MKRLLLSSLILLLSIPSGFSQTLNEDLGTPENQQHLFELSRSRETLNQVQLLHLGKNSAPARLQAIESAQAFVYFDMPYWFSDQEGLRTSSLLERKKTENPSLDLRIMTDWTTPIASDDRFRVKVFKKLKRISEGNILYWNAPGWKQRWSGQLLKHHLHDKLLIVDGKTLIMGGMNIADTYLHGGLTREGWHDTDLKIEGPAATEATKIFLKTWELTQHLRKAEEYSVPESRKELSALLQALYYDDRLEFEYERFFEKRSISLPLAERLNELAQLAAALDKLDYKTPVRLIYDNPLVDRDPVSGKQFSKTIRTLGFLFSKAREKIRIFMPYLTLTPTFKNHLVSAARRGLRVEIMTNSRIAHDLGKYPYYAAMSHYGELIDAGVAIYEWQGHTPLLNIEKANTCTIPSGQWPGNTLHTKAVIIDGEVVVMGSHNMNTRSQSYNSEIMALVRDADLASSLEEVFEQDLDRDPAKRTVICDSKELPRPRRIAEISREVVTAFEKEHRRALKFFRKLQFAM